MVFRKFIIIIYPFVMLIEPKISLRMPVSSLKADIIPLKGHRRPRPAMVQKKGVFIRVKSLLSRSPGLKPTLQVRLEVFFHGYHDFAQVLPASKMPDSCTCIA